MNHVNSRFFLGTCFKDRDSWKGMSYWRSQGVGKNFSYELYLCIQIELFCVSLHCEFILRVQIGEREWLVEYHKILKSMSVMNSLFTVVFGVF